MKDRHARRVCANRAQKKMVHRYEVICASTLTNKSGRRVCNRKIANHIWCTNMKPFAHPTLAGVFSRADSRDSLPQIHDAARARSGVVKKAFGKGGIGNIRSATPSICSGISITSITTRSSTGMRNRCAIGRSAVSTDTSPRDIIRRIGAVAENPPAFPESESLRGRVCNRRLRTARAQKKNGVQTSIVCTPSS